MPKRVWEGLGLPVRSDHVMTMSNTNTSTESTIGVVKNLALDFGAGEVYLQVQVVPRANFDLLLGRPFQCLLSAKTDDFPDGSQCYTRRTLVGRGRTRLSQGRHSRRDTASLIEPEVLRSKVQWCEGLKPIAQGLKNMLDCVEQEWRLKYMQLTTYTKRRVSEELLGTR